MDSRPSILIVEDDTDLCALVAGLLRRNGFEAATLPDGSRLDETLARKRVDLVILDVMLPGEDGLSLCRRLRAASGIPILMLTALGEDVDRIVGLEMGADDYLPKPFNPRELLARIRAVLRRSGTAAGSLDGPRRGSQMAFEGWRVDLGARKLHDPGGVMVAVTPGELDLLVAFCQHAGRVLTRDQLLDLTHGRVAAVADRSIDILVSRLRRKIEPDPKSPSMIETVRSGGYRFVPRVTVT